MLLGSGGSLCPCAQLTGRRGVAASLGLSGVSGEGSRDRGAPSRARSCLELCFQAAGSGLSASLSSGLGSPRKGRHGDGGIVVCRELLTFIDTRG